MVIIINKLGKLSFLNVKENGKFEKFTQKIHENLKKKKNEKFQLYINYSEKIIFFHRYLCNLNNSKHS